MASVKHQTYGMEIRMDKDLLTMDQIGLMESYGVIVDPSLRAEIEAREEK